MNLPEVKKALGVSPSINFESCNMQVNQAFAFQGDGARNRAKLLPELVENGIRVLIYAGDADMACNYLGNERWVEELETKFQPEFKKTVKQPWVTFGKSDLSGWVRSAGGDGFTAGNITYVQVHAAGYVYSINCLSGSFLMNTELMCVSPSHMVPFDQPEASLDLLSRWLADVPLTLNTTGVGRARMGGN